MKCLVCEIDIPEKSETCPGCGDHLGQWQERNTFAEKFLGEGAFFAKHGDALKAALCFLKAAVLAPEDARALKALGQFLAQQGCYEDATYYLEKAMAHAEGIDEEVQAAFDKLASLQAQPDQGACFLGLPDLVRDREKGDEPNQAKEAQTWAAAVDIEKGCPEALNLMGSVFSWPEPPSGACRGPWLYLRALCALAGGDVEAAKPLFRDCVSADASRRNAEVYLLATSSGSAEEVDSSVAFLKESGRSDADIARTLLIAADALANPRRPNADGAKRLLTKLEALQANKRQPPK